MAKVLFMNASQSRQQGAVLIFALVILFVLTLIGVSAMQISTTEEIMAGNMKDCNQGFQSAEAAIRDATKWLSSRQARPEADSNASHNVYAKGVYTLGDANTPATLSFDWNNKAIRYGELDSNATSITNKIGTCSPGKKPKDGGVMDDLYSLPCAVIEEHSFIPDNLDPDTTAKGIGRYYYRITARGFGGTDKAQSRLEAIVFQRYN
jgi:type IV pilus assembly protein PilX